MLENASQHIACDFSVSQELCNVPSRVYSIAACGWALIGLPKTFILHKVSLYFDVPCTKDMHPRFFFLPTGYQPVRWPEAAGILGPRRVPEQ